MTSVVVGNEKDLPLLVGLMDATRILASDITPASGYGQHPLITPWAKGWNALFSPHPLALKRIFICSSIEHITPSIDDIFLHLCSWVYTGEWRLSKKRLAMVRASRKEDGEAAPGAGAVQRRITTRGQVERTNHWRILENSAWQVAGCFSQKKMLDLIHEG